MAANKVKINIAGAEYSIIAEDDVKYVQSLGKALDLRMANIMKANSRISTTQAAILAALDYADEAHKSTLTADRLRDQIKDYLDDASSAKSKADWARHETENMKKEVEGLKAENERLRQELAAVLNTISEKK
ncbi:MAG: cell division protein ZapA [Clostridia bacterium]|nr:cell division protein ZapA [Clostridia bacterium]